jgi:hypothetical protein
MRIARRDGSQLAASAIARNSSDGTAKETASSLWPPWNRPHSASKRACLEREDHQVDDRQEPRHDQPKTRERDGNQISGCHEYAKQRGGAASARGEPQPCQQRERGDDLCDERKNVECEHSEIGYEAARIPRPGCSHSYRLPARASSTHARAPGKCGKIPASEFYAVKNCKACRVGLPALGLVAEAICRSGADDMVPRNLQAGWHAVQAGRSGPDSQVDGRTGSARGRCWA